MKSKIAIVASEMIERSIFVIRGHKVMLDADLAKLYGVETKALNRAVKRNRERFPGDFMFKLTTKEAESLRSQIGTSSWGGKRYLPHAFTEQGVATFSGVKYTKRIKHITAKTRRTQGFNISL